MQPVRAVVIGGQGRMGRYLCSALGGAGAHVASLDKPLQAGEVHRTLRAADLVLLSVPITSLDDVLQAILPALRPPTVLADICSVKVMPLRKMLQAYDGPVVGTHPLFGPEPGQEDALRVALCPGRDEEGLTLLERLFAASGCSTFRTTAETHDKAMAYIQGLNFVTTISYLSCLPEEKEIESFLTPSFRRRIDSARKMLVEDAQLFSALFEENPYSADCVRGFRSFLNIAAGGDLELVAQRALLWWREHLEEGEIRNLPVEEIRNPNIETRNKNASQRKVSNTKK
jgi:prephenate dehydrogenase